MSSKRAAPHIPERTCVSCRQVKPKQELIRIVRNHDGRLEIDPTGKKAGRGAYLCPARECWEAGLNKRSLQNALCGPLSDDDRKQVMNYMQELPEGV